MASPILWLSAPDRALSIQRSGVSVAEVRRRSFTSSRASLKGLPPVNILMHSAIRSRSVIGFDEFEFEACSLAAFLEVPRARVGAGRLPEVV